MDTTIQHKQLFNPFSLCRNKKSQQLHFCKLLTFRAETEICTRDPFITSEVLYR